MDTVYEKVNKLYNNKSYMARYGLDVWMTAIICLVFFVATSYYYTLNHIEPIKADWDNQKCNPSVIPFAGLINKSDDTTAMEFTNQNFTSCTQTILTNLTSHLMQPLLYLVNTITSEFSELANATNSIRGEFNKIRNAVSNFSEDTMGKTLNVTSPLVEYMISIKAMIGKTISLNSRGNVHLYGQFSFSAVRI